MLHSTKTSKKFTRSSLVRFEMAGLLIAGLIFSSSVPAAAEVFPSAENSDAGEITIHFTHYDAQDLTFYLNTDEAPLAFTDATLTFQDSTMDAPITMSYLSDDGSYTLYQNTEPVEEIDGTFSVSMVTEPGYQLDLDQISFYVNGQEVSNGGSVVITEPSAAMTSLIYCSPMSETPATDPVPSTPEASSSETPSLPGNSSTTESSGISNTPNMDSSTVSGSSNIEAAAPAESGTTVLPENAVSRDDASSSASESSAQIPIAAEPISDAVIAENESVDLSSIQPSSTVSSEAAGSPSRLPGATQLVPAAGTASPDAPVLSSETAASPEGTTRSEGTWLGQSRTASWLRQKTNQILAVMIAVILLLILVESLLVLKDSMHQKRSKKSHHFS